jgi:hypothetical protein
MGAALTKTSDAMSSALAPRSFDEVMRFAELLARSDFVPPAFKGKPGNVIAAVQMGAELGFSPMQSLQNIAVINGKPGVYGDGLLALIQGRPDCEDITEDKPTPANKMTATCTIKRVGRSAVVGTFSEEDAKKAQLWTKQGPWTQYPKRMLQMRARAFAIRDAFADALHGIGIVEELQDIPAREARVSVRGREPDHSPDNDGSRIGSGSAALPPHNAETGDVIDAEGTSVPTIPYGVHKDKRVDDDSVPGGYLRDFLEPALVKAVADPKKR